MWQIYTGRCLKIYPLTTKPRLFSGKDPGDEGTDIAHNASLLNKPMNWAPSKVHFILHEGSCCMLWCEIVSTFNSFIADIWLTSAILEKEKVTDLFLVGSVNTQVGTIALLGDLGQRQVFTMEVEVFDVWNFDTMNCGLKLTCSL